MGRRVFGVRECKEKRKKKEDEKEQPQQVTNALFVGSTAELQKMINGR